MTGEMGWNDLKDYPEIMALAKKIQSSAKVAAEVRPFDVYQGPYIAIDFDSAPLRGTGKNKLGSWQAQVWYCSVPGHYVFDYRHNTTPHLTPAAVIKMVKELKERRK